MALDDLLGDRKAHAQAARLAGEAGVAAITVVLYAQFLMTSAFMGFSGGVAPVISYNYGRRNDAQLRKIFRISMGAVTAASS